MQCPKKLLFGIAIVVGVSGLGEAIEAGCQSQDQEEYLRHVETHPEEERAGGKLKVTSGHLPAKPPMCPAIGLPAPGG
jgi:hypothetical protein